jgi:hypothetical protein
MSGKPAAGRRQRPYSFDDLGIEQFARFLVFIPFFLLPFNFVSGIFVVN